MTIEELERVGRVAQATAFEAVNDGSNPSPAAHSKPRLARGYCGIGLLNPKTGPNIGSVMRAVGIYGAAFLAIEGDRFRRCPADTMKHWRHIPVISGITLHEAIPYDCVPVAVDLVERAKPLTTYKHPERAFYIFGPEDGTLGERHLSWCRDVVYVPTNGCMNLAAAVNVVLYDRMAKSQSQQGGNHE